jgi:DNA-binding MarR family transcriptional regulator
MSNPTQKPVAALKPEEGSSNQVDCPPDLVKIYVYRHLLQNMETTRRSTRLEEKKQAPRVKGPRAAALLARLWANEDLNLPATPQKVISHELGLGESEVTKMLKDLRSTANGERCVELISDGYAREKLYQITDAGKRALECWILAHYTHGSFLDLVKKVIPDAKNVGLTLDWLRGEARRNLG